MGSSRPAGGRARSDRGERPRPCRACIPWLVRGAQRHYSPGTLQPRLAPTVTAVGRHRAAVSPRWQGDDEQALRLQLENRPGELAHLARALTARGIGIRHIAGGGVGPHGFASLDAYDFGATHDVLSGMGYDFVEGETLVVQVLDGAETLAAIGDRLANAGASIQSVMTVSRCGDEVELALVVDDCERARSALEAATVLA